MTETGKSERGRFDGARAGGLYARASWLLVAVGLCLALAPAALASSPSFTWTGSAEFEEWSQAENWAGKSAPVAHEKVGTLAFPRLTSESCTGEEEEFHACYFSENDLEGLSAKSLELDDGDIYEIDGEALELGSGGLIAAPASGSSGRALDFLDLPLELSASQKWSVSGRGTGELSGLALEGEVEGPQGPGTTLAVELSKDASLYLENYTEVGPVTISGASASKAGFENGIVDLAEGELNSEDGKAVDLSHVFLFGSGAVGALTTDDAEVDVGGELEPGAIEATSVKLDPATKIAFRITGKEMIPEADYSQLLAEGAVELGGATIGVEVGPASKGGVCPELVTGHTYTFVSTTKTLSGTFANAPEHGSDIPINFAASCGNASQVMRIDYGRSGPIETVTATVEAKPVISEDPLSTTVAEGASATFKAAATGAASVQWQVNRGTGAFEADTIDQGVTTDTLTVEHAIAAESGYEYRAVFENGAGEVSSTPATLTVEAKPVVSEDPLSTTVVEGASATFNAADTGAASVQWQVKRGTGTFEADTIDLGVTTDTLTVEHASAAESGYEYRAVFKNGAGETPTTVATLTVETLAERQRHEEEAAKAKQQEEAAIARQQEEAAIARQQEEAATAAAIKKRQAEEVAIAAAKKSREEAAAKGGVLAAKEGSPDATIADTSLSVASSGAFVVKIECPAGETSCTGTITVRTLKAVIAGVPGREAKQKASVLTLASGSFTVAGGQTKAVTLHLSATARHLLARSHVLSARATIVAHDPAGGTHTGQTIVTLRAPKAKRGKS
jgi:hypothetical protein